MLSDFEWALSLGLRCVVLHQVWTGLEGFICSEFVNTHLFDQELSLQRYSRIERRTVMYYALKGTLLVWHAVSAIWHLWLASRSWDWDEHLETIGIAAMWSVLALDLCMILRSTSGCRAVLRRWDAWYLLIACGVASMYPVAREWTSFYMMTYMMSAPLYIAVSAHSLDQTGRRPSPSQWKACFALSVGTSILGWGCIALLFGLRVWTRTAKVGDWIINCAAPILFHTDASELQRLHAWFCLNLNARQRAQKLY